MKAIINTQAGGPSVLQLVERPVPAVAAGQVRVRIAVSRVNPTDWKARQSATAVAAGGAGPQPGRCGRRRRR